jgi:hypothetical protein
MAAVHHLVEAMDRWFPPTRPTSISFLTAPRSSRFAGVVSLADWIGSNRAEGFFPYEGDGDDDRGAARTSSRSSYPTDAYRRR